MQYVILSPSGAWWHLEDRHDSTIGRGPDCAIHLEDPAASREHARLEWVSDVACWRLRDLGSANGTMIAGHCMNGPVTLFSGDRIQIGATFLDFLIISVEEDFSQVIADWQAGKRPPKPEITALLQSAPRFVLDAQQISFKQLMISLAEAKRTGSVLLDRSDNFSVRLVDGVPRWSSYFDGNTSKRGLSGLIAAAQYQAWSYAFLEGEIHRGPEEVPGTSEAILLAMFGAPRMGNLDESDLAQAERLQRHIFGQAPTIAGYDLAVRQEGASRVTGDFWDIGPLSDGRIMLTIGDVSGHGLQAALAVAGIMKSLRLLRSQLREVPQLLARLNAEVRSDLPIGQFCTMCVAVLTPHSGRLVVYLAGHHQAMTRQADGSIGRVGIHGPAMGLLEPVEFATALTADETFLTPGMSFLQFTDGLTEAEDADRQPFGEKGVEKILTTGDWPHSAKNVIDALTQGCRAHAKAIEDDVTVLVFSRRETSVEHLRRVSHHSWNEAQESIQRCLETQSHDSGSASDFRATSCLTTLDLLPKRSLHDKGGDYQIQHNLGAGGMGRILAVRQVGLERELAVKVLPENATRSRQRRLIAEAQVTAALEHPGIIPVHELAFDAALGPFYSMKRVRGHPWSDQIRQLSLRNNLQILLRICDPLAYAHSLGVIHRDLKPSNILLGNFGEVLIADWGMAAYVGSPGTSLAALIQPPQSGVISGTPAYIPPESALADVEKMSYTSDIYLLGAILYEILSGHPPHPGRGVDETLKNAGENQISPYQVSADDSGLMTIALGAMASESRDRYLNIQDFQLAIEDHLAHRESIILTTQAQNIFDLANNQTGYEGYIRAQTLAEEAIRLWRTNYDAQSLLKKVGLAYVTRAIERKDAELARALLEAMDPVDTREQLFHLARLEDQLKESSEAQKELSKLQARLAHEAQKVWTTIYTLQPTPEGLDRDWIPLGGQISATAQGFVIEKGEPQGILLRAGCEGDLRLSIGITVEDLIPNDITVVFAANRALLDAQSRMKSAFLDSAYQIKIGVYDNSIDLFIRKGKRRWSRQGSSLVNGKNLPLVIERQGPIITCHLDGNLLFSFEDPDPIVGQDAIAIMGWRAKQTLRSFTVERLGMPLKTGILELAAHHTSLGHTEVALALWRDALASPLTDQDRIMVLSQLQNLEDRRSSSFHLPAFITRIKKTWPEATVERHNETLSVCAERMEISDLSVLNELPIQLAFLDENHIENLFPLAKCPLQELHVGNNHLQDLCSLHNPAINSLYLSKNQLKSLKGIHRCRLVSLSADRNDLLDIGGIEINQYLLNLDLRYNPRLSDIAALDNVVVVNCLLSNTKVSDLRHLTRSQVTSLYISALSIKDLSPVCTPSLKHLYWNDAPSADLSPLADTKLEQLIARNSLVRSLRPLANLPLQILDLRKTVIQDGSRPPPHLVEFEPGFWYDPSQRIDQFEKRLRFK
jgi:serine/threonine protein kinase